MLLSTVTPVRTIGNRVQCRPGDLTVTRTPKGYLIGRVRTQLGPGPWWEYVAIVRTFQEAVHHACTVARYEGVKSWLQIGLDEYRPLTETTAEPPPH